MQYPILEIGITAGAVTALYLVLQICKEIRKIVHDVREIVDRIAK